MDSIRLTFTPQPLKKFDKVYIIDDNSVEREMLADYFEKYNGVTVQGFSTGDDCVKNIVNSGVMPDMILLDYFLDAEVAHSRDGLEILVKLKEISPDSSIIMHTGVENQRIIDLARKKGAFDYIIKGTDGFKKLDSIIETHFAVKSEE